MIEIRKSEERGYADHGWLKSYHTFSFAGYYDPNFMHYDALRVINEDWVAPGKGFAEHAHDNMEIITYVLSGQLEHKDSMGNGEVLKAGEFQKISAGSGITHSEFNPSATEEVHLYQIWLIPENKNTEPNYQQKAFELNEQTFKLVASPNGADESFQIERNCNVFLAKFAGNNRIDHQINPTNKYWLQVLAGELSINNNMLVAGDAINFTEENMLNIETFSEENQLMLFEFIK